ncbi:MAG: fibronectin type III domain-containing protein, partial [Bacteroidales bacterium]
SRIPSGLNFGMGEWDVMDFGSYNNDSKTPAGYSAYEKSFVGWMKLQELINPASVTLNPLSDSNEAYVIHSEQNRDEFFVFENRQLSKWDEYLPAAGLLITHVDYNQTIWNNNAVNNEAGRQRVTLVPADNKLLVYNNNNQQYFNSLLGDPYPGSTKNTAFTDNSTPAAVLNNGTKLGKPVTEITHSKGVVTFEFLKDFVSTPKALPATDIRSNGFTANWEAVEGATGYSLNISPVINGEKIISENFDKFTRGSESNPDGTDIGSKLDNYMQQAGWSGEKIYQAGKSCKIGSNSTKGHLITPALNLSAGNGVITVYYTVKGKSGLSQGIKLSLTSDAAGNSPFEEISRNLSTSAKRECVVFKQAPTNAYLKFKLFAVGYLDDFAVYSGDVSAQEPVASRTAVQMPILIENIQETTYQISGLTPGTTYAYNVLATKDGNKSEWSAPVNVTTDYSTGLADTKEALQLYVNGNQLIINGYKGKQAVLYDFSGKILRSQLLDSDVTTLVCEKGFYLVRIGTQTAKIHIGE